MTSHSAEIPAGAVVYAVGDIHGRLDLLEAATVEITEAAESAAKSGRRITAVFLGDYIDRGPDAKGVISHLLNLREAAAFDTIFLRGNHEQFLLDLIDGRGEASAWLEYGGIQTLNSYGVDALAFRDATELADAVRAALPLKHIQFLRETELHVERGDYVFVHAGMRPDRLLTEQSDSDLLWFRYYNDEHPTHGRTVVHGHTPRAKPVAGRWRIGIDTEAWASGMLTLARFEGSDRTFLKVELSEAGSTQIEEWEQLDRPHDRPHVSAGRDAKERQAHSNQFERRGLIAIGAVAGTLFLVALAGVAWRLGDHTPTHAAPIVAAGKSTH